MKLLSYNYRGLERVGVYVGEKIAHLSRLAGIFDKKELAFGSMIELIKSWKTHGPALHDLIAQAEAIKGELSPVLVAPEDVHHLSPIPHPPKHVLCMGLNYQDHVNEGLQAKDVQTAKVELDHPIFFTKAPSTLIGHNESIPAHRVTEKLDYEAEIAVIIGKRGKNIRPVEAYAHVFGYCCANDISARDIQRRHKQIFKGKTLDGTCPLGPYIVPKEDYGNPMNQSIKSWVNGEARQDSNTNMMIHDIPSMLSVLSEGFTLEPGDIFLTGTPAGVGYAREIPSFLRPGDVVEVEVGGLGRLRNEVIEAD